MTIHASRRDVLKGGGALVVSFSLAGALGETLAQGAKPLALTEVDSFLAIDAGGVVTLYSGKVDLGTGVATALPQMVADELDVPFNRVKLVQGDTALTPDQGPTWGSLSIQIGGMQLRNAAATAKAALLDEAAKRLGAKQDELKVVDGVVSAGNKRVSYGELVAGKSFALKLDHTKPAARKNPKDYKLVGKPVPRVDIPDKVTGRFTYMQDFRVPGMLHGRVVRPPAIGATLESVDEGSIKDVVGVVKVVREGNFLGVVAESEWGAIKAAEKLKASWSKSQTLPDAAKLWDEVRASKVAKEEVTSNVGNTADAMGQAGAKTLKATYDFAIHTHGSIGPSCAVAEFKDGKLTSWSASQATHNLRKQLATMFGMPADSVRCIYVEGSGCYGRNGHEDAAADAALLAKTVARTSTAGTPRVRRRSSTSAPPWMATSSPPGNRSSSFRSRPPAALTCHWSPRRLRACRLAMTSRPATFSRTRRSRTNSPTSRRCAAGSQPRRSAPPGSARRGGCRTPMPTSASSTSSPRRRTPTPSSFG